jgi:DNA-binding response OmpR family regulator
MTDHDPTVLVVDDEQQVADAYALRLQMEYDDVRKAYGGKEALETVDESVDVVLLDRRMPDYSGGEVLEKMRERGLDCSVIMVTAVDPDFDIVDMPFDDYLCKPVEKEALFDAIEQQLKEKEYDDDLQEYFSVVSKIGVLESQKPSYELEDHEEYQELKAKADELREEVDDAVQGFDDMESAFMTIDRN